METIKMQKINASEKMSEKKKKSICKNIGKKSLIFTLDAILALLLASSLILGALFFISQQRYVEYSRYDLYKISMDSLAVLEKDSSLRTAIEQNTNVSIKNFLDALPYTICANITLYDSSKTKILEAPNNCTASDEFALARRVFVAFIAQEQLPYYAEMRAWYS